MTIRGPHNTEPPWPGDILSSKRQGIRRLNTEPGDTAQDDGRVFRLSKEFSIPVGGTLVLRFTSPIDFRLRYQSLSVDGGGIRLRTFRSDSGTEGGTWNPEPIFGNNSASYVSDYTPVITIDSGGTFDLNVAPPAVPAETFRVRSAGAVAQKTTVSGSIGDNRALGADVYYIVMQPLSGVTGNSEGVYNLRYEEFPFDKQ